MLCWMDSEFTHKEIVTHNIFRFNMYSFHKERIIRQQLLESESLIVSRDRMSGEEQNCILTTNRPHTMLNILFRF